MSVGIPIVPIVIRNAEVIAARDSSTFNPGTVDVVVYPPIPVDDWTHDNLDGPHRRGASALPRHARRTGRTTRLPTPRALQAPQACAKKAPAKKARRQEAAAKKTAASGEKPPRRRGCRSDPREKGRP